jgi:hypothetical protein
VTAEPALSSAPERTGESTHDAAAEAANTRSAPPTLSPEPGAPETTDKSTDDGGAAAPSGGPHTLRSAAVEIEGAMTRQILSRMGTHHGRCPRRLAIWDVLEERTDQRGDQRQQGQSKQPTGDSRGFRAVAKAPTKLGRPTEATRARQGSCRILHTTLICR